MILNFEKINCIPGLVVLWVELVELEFVLVVLTFVAPAKELN